MTPRAELPLPTPAFRLGVVGNRSLQGTDANALAATTAEFLANLRSAIAASMALLADTTPQAYAPGPPRLFLMNSLAEGADQLVAEIVLARNEGYHVRCPIPFTSETYKSFFTYDRDVSIETFDRITSTLENDPIIVELCCPPDETKRSNGYAAAADILLDNSDLLFAIYDFSRAGSEGGTAETVRKALEAGVSVVGLDARHPGKLFLLRTGGERRALTPRLLNDIVERILLPPRSIPLRRFLREPLMTGNRITQIALRLLSAVYGAFWNVIPWVGAIRSASRPSAPSLAPDAAAPSEQNPAQGRAIDEVQRPYRERMAPVDTLAAFYMNLYRGSFVMNFTFGALAVLFGLLSHFNYENASSWLRLEIVALGIIVSNFMASRLWDWQGRALDYRFIAEHLRQMMTLAPLGRSAPLVRPPAHYEGHDPTDSWMRWYVLALDRDQGLIDFDAPAAPAVLRMNDTFVSTMRSRLRDEWLVGQYRYYQSAESRFKGAMAVLRGLMLLLFIVTVAGVGAHFMHVSIALDAESWREDSVLIIIVAGLPAFLGALHGIAVQGELEIIAERARDMSAHLATIIAEMTRAAQAGNTSAIELSSQAVRAAQMMLGETLDWRIIHQAHEVELT